MLEVSNIKRKQFSLLSISACLMLILMQNYFLLPNICATTAKIIFPFIVIVLCLLKHRYQLINFVFLVWMTVFFLISLCSVLFAQYFDTSLDFFITEAISFLMMVAVSQYADTEDNIENVLNFLVIGGLLYGLYVFLREYKTIFYISITTKYTNGSIMQFTYVMLPTCYFLIWRLIYRKNYRLLTSIMIAFSYLMNILSGRKKALIFPILFLFVLMMLKNRKNFLKIAASIVAVLLIGSVLIYISLHNEILYSVIGKRIMGLVSYLNGDGRIDGSTVARSELLSGSWNVFVNHPLFGIGLGNFMMTNNFGYYAHDNYLELLSGIGIIGTVAYYWIEIYVLYYLFKIMKSEKSKSGLAELLITLIIINLIHDLATVSYNRPYFNMFICLAAAFISIRARKASEGMVLSYG